MVFHYFLVATILKNKKINIFLNSNILLIYAPTEMIENNETIWKLQLKAKGLIVI